MRIPILNTLITIMLFFVISSISIADSNCNDVRLDRNGGPFEKIPVYDQWKFSEEDPGICYAVTASQMMDADRFYNGDRELKQLSSPFSVAINRAAAVDQQSQVKIRPYTGKSASEIVGFGTIESAFKTNTNRPVCDQKALEGYTSLISSKKIEIPIDFQNPDLNSPDNFLRAILDQVNQAQTYKHRMQFDTTFSIAECDLNQYFRSRLTNQKNAQDLQAAALQALDERSISAQAKIFLDKICQENNIHWIEKHPVTSNGYTNEEKNKADQEAQTILEKLSTASENKKNSIFEEYVKFKKIHERNPQGMQSTVSKILSSEKPAPIGISYNSGVLDKNGDGGNHGSIIIGQRFNQKTNTCEFLVRNSYGTNCKTKKMNYKWPCESGNLWVPGPALFPETYEITYLPR